MIFFFFFQAEDGIRDYKVTGVQTCALPISMLGRDIVGRRWADPWDSPTLPEKRGVQITELGKAAFELGRSEEHTSELQSPCNLVCRLLLEKKKKNNNTSVTRYKRRAPEQIH